MNKTPLPPHLEDIPPEAHQLAQQLLKLRQEPGLELRRAIQTIPQHRRARLSWLPQLSWGLTTLLVLALLFVSPAANATLSRFEQFVGQIHLIIMEVFPRQVEPMIEESKVISLAEARRMMPFNFALPRSLPAGLKTMNPEISILELDSPILKLLWRDTGGGFVQLTIHPPTQPGANYLQTLIGPESSETISINGHPAALIYGGWDGESQTWSHQDRLTTLIWKVDNIQYKLLAYSDFVSTAELITMAESIH
jgi:hypothetical protein